ncbi:hypothetical protein [Mediterraneibacter sp. ICN-202921]|uniref:hypothetical protein n=1 Tax=Mediterraneibacter sp. ICN-202921 TaxID=3134657 RepID=UPI0030BE0877
MKDKFVKLFDIKRKYTVVILSFFLSLAVAFFLFVFDKIYYMMADDYLMHLISAGEFGTGKDAYLVFINIILGYIISGLNKLFPWGDWFILVYIFTIVNCFACLVFVFLRKVKRVLPVVGLLLIETIIFYNLTFSIIAYLCITTSLIYWYYLIDEKSKITIGRVLIICAFFCMGIFYRKSVWLSAVILFLPLVVVHIKQICKTSTIIIVGSLVFVFLSACYINEQAYASSSLWKEYKEFNKIRPQIVDNIPIVYEDNVDELQKIGLSENDLKCVYRWIFADKETFSIENMQELAELNPVKEKWNFNIPDILKKMLTLKYNYYFFIIIVLAFYFNEKKWYPYLTASALISYAQIAALYVRNRPVERIMLPIYFIGAVLLFLHSQKKLEQGKKYAVVNIVYLTIFVLTGVGLILENREKVSMYENKNEQYKIAYDYINSHSEVLFVGSSTTINEISYSDPVFEIGTQMSSENVIKLGSWDIYSSRYYHQANKYGIEDKDRLILGMVDNKNVNYIVQKQNKEELIILEQYMKEHTEKDIDFVLKDEVSGMSIYQVVTMR